MAEGAGGAPVVEATTRKTLWIRRSVWILAIFGLIGVVILGDFQAIAGASSISQVAIPWRSSRQRSTDVVVRVDMSKPGNPEEFRKARDGKEKAGEKAMNGKGDGGDGGAKKGDQGDPREDDDEGPTTNAPDLATTGWVAWPPPNPPPSRRDDGGGSGNGADATAAASDLRDEQTAYREASKKVDGSNPDDDDQGETKTPAADVDEVPPAAEKTADDAAPRAPATLEKYGWVAWPPPNPPPAV